MATTSRPTQAQRREQTRRALLDAARTVFGRRGFGAAPLDEIAEAAGVTRGALYYNFPGGKEDLFLALLGERLDERGEAIRTRFAATDNFVIQARAAADDAFAAVGPNREWQLLTFEFALHAARDRAFARQWVESENRIRDVIEDVVRRSADEIGAELPLSARDLATGLNALGVGLALDALVDEGSVPDELFGALVGFLVRGLIATVADQATTTRKGRR